MHRDNLKIAEPCGEDWDAMTGDEQRRHCEHCAKNVTDLSQMTEDDATSFLQGSIDQNVCVRYSCDKDGRVRFKPSAEEASFWSRLNQQRRGLASLMASGALVLAPLGLEDCRPLPPLNDDVSSWSLFESSPTQGEVMGDVDYVPTPPAPHVEVVPEDTDHVLMGEPLIEIDEEAPTTDDSPQPNPIDRIEKKPATGQGTSKLNGPKIKRKPFKITPDRETLLGKVSYEHAP